MTLVVSATTTYTSKAETVNDYVEVVKAADADSLKAASLVKVGIKLQAHKVTSAEKAALGSSASNVRVGDVRFDVKTDRPIDFTSFGITVTLGSGFTFRRENNGYYSSVSETGQVISASSNNTVSFTGISAGPIHTDEIFSFFAVSNGNTNPDACSVNIVVNELSNLGVTSYVPVQNPKLVVSTPYVLEAFAQMMVGQSSGKIGQTFYVIL